MKKILTILILLCIHNACVAAEVSRVTVHITGYVNNPGSYELSKKSNVAEIRIACGGWNKEKSSPGRVVVMRFSRPSTPTENFPDHVKDLKRVLDFRKEDKNIELAVDDVIFVPEKISVGR